MERGRPPLAGAPLSSPLLPFLPTQAEVSGCMLRLVWTFPAFFSKLPCDCLWDGICPWLVAQTPVKDDREALLWLPPPRTWHPGLHPGSVGTGQHAASQGRPEAQHLPIAAQGPLLGSPSPCTPGARQGASSCACALRAQKETRRTSLL